MSDGSMNRNDDDMLPEYDLSHSVKGRYAGRFYVDPATPAGTTVVLRRAVPDHGLQPGDVGRLIGSEDRSSLQVEFEVGANRPSIRLVVRPGDLRLLRPDEVLHTRNTRAG
jgi:hypothetical protein